MQAKAQAKATAHAQTKVASQDANMIAMLKKQITMMEAKAKP